MKDARFDVEDGGWKVLCAVREMGWKMKGVREEVDCYHILTVLRYTPCDALYDIFT